MKIIACICSMSVSSFSQNWINAGLPVLPLELKTIHVDTASQRMFVGGLTPINTSGGMTVCMFDGNNWSVMDTFNNVIRSIITYHNELYVAGDFNTVNSQAMKAITKWNGTNWVNISGNITNSVVNMKVLNDTLYAVGSFTQIGGITASGVAKWDGINWSDVHAFPTNSGGQTISDIEIYNGDIYVGGNFSTTLGGITDIAMYKNGTWQRVGGSLDTLRGGFTGVATLQVYNNELYAGGLILQYQGNVGHGIQKWNGTNWSEVGTGVQGAVNDNNNICQIHKLRVYENKLFASGNFQYAGNGLCPKIACWDGQQWCGFSREIGLNNTVTSFNFYKDTLYIGTIDSIEHIYVNQLAKFAKGTTVDTCSINFTGINLGNDTKNSITIYPNPSSDKISIILSETGYEKYMLYLYSITGEKIYQSQFNSNEELEINISNFSPGMYFIKLINSDKTLVTKFIKE